MNKLIEKIKTKIMLRDIGIKNDLDTLESLEQIIDDFSVKFAEWLQYNYYADKPMNEILQIFKDNIYGKE